MSRLKELLSTLKNKLIGITNKGIEDRKKQKEAEERERTKGDREKAKVWANKIIEDLPKQMEEAAEKGETRIMIPFDKDNKSRRFALDMVKKWAELEGFIAEISSSPGSCCISDRICIMWIWDEDPGPFYYE